MKISEFAAKAKVNIETIRYYQRLGLIRKPDSKGTIRRYEHGDLEALQFIKNAKSAGFSLDEIKTLNSLDVIEDRPKILALSQLKSTALHQRIEELEKAKHFLDSLVNECKESILKPCPILQALQNKRKNIASSE